MGAVVVGVAALLVAMIVCWPDRGEPLVGKVVRVMGPTPGGGRVVEYRKGRHLILRSVAASGARNTILLPLSTSSQIETVAASEGEFHRQQDDQMTEALDWFLKGRYDRALDLFLRLREFDADLPCLRFFSGISRLGKTGGNVYRDHPLLLEALADFEGLSDEEVDCGSLFLGFDLKRVVVEGTGFGLVSFYRGLASSMAGREGDALAFFRRLNRLGPDERVMSGEELAGSLEALTPAERWRMFTRITARTVQAILEQQAEKKSLRM